MKRLSVFISFVAALAIGGPVFAQTISQPAGCVASIACQAGRLAIGGAALDGNALAVTGTAQFNGSVFLIPAASILWQGQTLLAPAGDGGFRISNNTQTIGATLYVPASNVLQHGGADAATAVAQIIQPQSVVAGTSNTAGADFTIAGSRGTGIGAGGSIVFQTAAAGSTGTAQNVLVSRWKFDQNGHFTPAFNNAQDIGTPALGVRNVYALGTTTGGSLALGGATIGSNALAVTGTANISGTVTTGTINVTGSVLATGNQVAGSTSLVGWLNRTSLSAPVDGLLLFAKNAGGQLTVSTLPSCTTGLDGTRAFVTDAAGTTFATAVAGTGSNHVPVYCDGSGTPTWRIG